MTNYRASIIITLFMFLILSGLSLAGPPDKSVEEEERILLLNKDSLHQLLEDSLLLKMDGYSESIDSIRSSLDSLRRLDIEFEDLPDLPSFPEIIIDEKGVIKVLTDSGFIVLSNDSLPPLEDRYLIDDMGYHPGEITRFGKDIIIDEGERLNSDIVLISGDVTVNGSVEGDIVVVGGDIYINSTGYIRGDATVVGGRIKKEEGAKVTGATVSIGIPILVLPHGSWMQVFEGILILIALVSVFFSAMAISLFPAPIDRISTKLKEQPFKSFIFGYLLYFGAFLVWLLLLVSVIGIPLAILGQPIAMLVLGIFGYAAINVILGEKLFKASKPIKSFLLGCLITTVIPIFLLMIGYVSNLLVFFVFNAILLGILMFVFLPFGLGAATLARFGLPRRKRGGDEENNRDIAINITASSE